MHGPIEIVVYPVRGVPDYWEARLGTTILAHSKTPFLASARTLIIMGHDPTTIMTMRHDGAATWSLKSTIAKAASLRVAEASNGTPVFAKYRPFEGAA